MCTTLSVKTDFERLKIFEISVRNKVGITCRFLKTIAFENKFKIDVLINHLSKWYFKLNHKKFGLICYSQTNSGKSLLADLLTSQYRDWEIGTFSCPPGTHVSQFYLDALLNTHIYRCHEIIFENLNIVQKMKNLLEGSRLLDIDVKYKSKMQITPAPVIMNLNGSSLSSIFKWCHEEILAFKSRCVFLKIDIPLHHRTGSDDFSYLASCGKEFIYILTKKFMDIKDRNIASVKDHTHDICI